MTKILITGAAGFIGFHLSRRFIDENCEVIGLDNINDYYDINLKYRRLNKLGIGKKDINYNELISAGNFKFIKLDIEDKLNIDFLFKEHTFDFVIHLAARTGVRHSVLYPCEYIKSNIIGFLNILEASRSYKVKHLIFASSSSVYGLNKNIPFNTNDPVGQPISIYGSTKISNELMGHTYSYLYNIPITGIRFFTVYGPWGRPDMAYFKFTEAIQKGKEIEVYNNGLMKRDFTYIDDIVHGVTKLIYHIPSVSPPFKVFNFGNNNPVNLLYFINLIEKELGKEAKKIYLPLQPGDIVETSADMDELINEIDYRPEINIEEGIKLFVDWYLEEVL